MEPGNHIGISEFLLCGFSEELDLQSFLYGLLRYMYLTTVFGNLLTILATITDSHFHTPMYFFLSNLSFIDICLTTTTMPEMLVNIQTQIRVIIYAGFLTQMYFFMLFTGLDDFLLAVMAYDCFMAICHPFNYMTVMNLHLCRLLVLGFLTMSAVHSLLQCLMVLWLSFCNHLELLQFFCDHDLMIQLSCSDNFLNEIVMYCAVRLLVFGPFTGIIFSFSKFFSSVCKISSVQGKYKAFSSCASHLSVVSLFYGTVLGVYLISTASPNPHSTAPASVMYTVATPMLNPSIYSLRNKEMIRALKRFFRREVIKCHFLWGLGDASHYRARRLRARGFDHFMEQELSINSDIALNMMKKILNHTLYYHRKG